MQSFRINKRSVIGLFILAFGILLFLGALDLVDASEILSNYWPIILIIIGLLGLIDRSTSKVFSFLLIILGVFYQLKVLNIFFEDISIWQFVWPAFIIIIGIWFIFPKKKFEDTSDTLNSTAIFAGGDIFNTSQDFRGGEVSAVFGGLEIDLTQADIISEEPVIIDTFIAFGGIDFKVPENWIVDIKGLPLFGGWDNKRKRSKVASNPETKVITIKCLILFGGMDIK